MKEFDTQKGFENSNIERSEVKNIPILDEEIEPRFNTHHESIPIEQNPTPASKEKKKAPRMIAMILMVSLVGGLSIGAGSALVKNYFEGFKYENHFYLDSAGDSTNASFVVSQTGVKSVVDIAEQLRPSVVAITSKLMVRDFFNTYQSEGAGSGVIFNVNNDSVVILTNNHVIDGAEEVTIDFNEFTSSKANVVGVDPETDIAVIEVPRENIPVEVMSTLRPAVFGDSDHLKVGELAVAIGNPLGYNHTVTVGVISALNRELQVSANSFNLIQTDAAINPGNSGGALVNGKGEVVGINSIKIADTQVEGIGFAIPINSIKPIVNQLLTNGYVSRPYMGISGRNVDEQISEVYELPMGVFVIQVLEGSAASDADIRKGDVIISVDDEKIMSMEQIVNLVKNHQVGDELELKIVRNGNEKLVKKVKLKEKNLAIQ